MRNMMGAKTATGKVRTMVPTKQMMTGQAKVMMGTLMKTNKGRDMDYKKRLKEM